MLTKTEFVWQKDHQIKGIHDIKNMRKIKTKEQKIGFRNMHLKKNLESQQKGEKKKK